MKNTKKILSVFLAVLLIALSLPMGIISVGAAENTGMTGEGTEADPYVIEDADGWKAFVTAANASADTTGWYVELGADIDFTGCTTFTDLSVSNFCGTFNGNGKTIKNLDANVTVAKAAQVALFANIGAGAVIKNLKIDDVTLTVTGYTDKDLATAAAVLVGMVSGDAEITDITITDTKITQSETGTTYVSLSVLAAIVGSAKLTVNNITMDNVHSEGKVSEAGYGSGNLLVYYLSKGDSKLDAENISANNCKSISAKAYTGLVGWSIKDGSADGLIKLKDVTVSYSNIEGNGTYAGMIVSRCTVPLEVDSVTVEHCTLTTSSTYLGLFAVCEKGNNVSIKNVTVKNTTMGSNATYTGVIGACYDGGEKFEAVGVNVIDSNFASSRNNNNTAVGVVAHVASSYDSFTLSGVNVINTTMSYNRTSTTTYAVGLGIIGRYTFSQAGELSITNSLISDFVITSTSTGSCIGGAIGSITFGNYASTAKVEVYVNNSGAVDNPVSTLVGSNDKAAQLTETTKTLTALNDSGHTYSLSLEGDIGINIDLSVTEDFKAVAAAKAGWGVEYNGKTYKADSEGKVQIPVAAKDAVNAYELKPVIFFVVDEEKENENYFVFNEGGEVSAKTYAEALASDESKTEVEQALGAAILEYVEGAAAYFAGNEVTAPESAVENNAGYTVEDNSEAVNFNGIALILEAKTTLRFYFTSESAVEGLTRVGETNVYYYDVSDIAAKDLGADQTVEIGDIEVDGITVTASALTYCNVVDGGEQGENLANLAKIVASYNAAAVAYFG